LIEDGAAQMLVRLDLNGSALLARLTRKSAQALQLAPGKKLYAQVKTVALVD
jgi:molybdate transport system ATP-binding protein